MSDPFLLVGPFGRKLRQGAGDGKVLVGTPVRADISADVMGVVEIHGEQEWRMKRLSEKGDRLSGRMAVPEGILVGAKMGRKRWVGNQTAGDVAEATKGPSVMGFPQMHTLVTGGRKNGTERRPCVGNSGNRQTAPVRDHTGLMRPAARPVGGPGGKTEGTGGIGVGEADALAGQTVEMRRSGPRIPVDANGTLRQLIGDDE